MTKVVNIQNSLCLAKTLHIYGMGIIIITAITQQLRTLCRLTAISKRIRNKVRRGPGRSLTTDGCSTRTTGGHSCLTNIHVDFISFKFNGRNSELKIEGRFV